MSRPWLPARHSHEERSMRVQWWQSIRWRLAIGSLLVALLTTILLASITIITINISYGGQQRQNLVELANGTAQRIGLNYTYSKNLFQASDEAVPGLATQSATGEQYLQLVYTAGRPTKLIYPRGNKGQT